MKIKVAITRTVLSAWSIIKKNGIYIRNFKVQTITLPFHSTIILYIYNQMCEKHTHRIEYFM